MKTSGPSDPASYAALGVREVINADATLTRLGGSRMPPEVVRAMAGAASAFVDLDDLQRRVGERIAGLTGNEAAYVTSGAAAGLALATVACIVGTGPGSSERSPDLRGLKDEIVVQRLQRNGYDYAVRQVGATIVDVGTETGTTADAFRAAIGPRTAAVFWFQGAMNRPGELPLPAVIDIAASSGVPVVVDAAAQLPPVSNLWEFTRMGAELAIFSGGKDLRGPQSSGLVLGRRERIEACRAHGNPNHAVGRPMKVGKEEMVGLLAAVERYLALDHGARERACEDTVAMWNAALGSVAGIGARRDFPNEAGQPLPRTLLTLGPGAANGRDEVVRLLWSGDPAIAVARSGDDGILLNPMTLDLEGGEAERVRDRLLEILG